MRQFRVVLLGPSGEPRPSACRTVAAEASEPRSRWHGRLAGYSSCRAWFAPEPIQVNLSRPVRGPVVPPDWELSLVPGGLERAAAVTLAAAGVLGALASPAEAAPAVAPIPPSVQSSSTRTFVPTDQPPRVVLLEAREARTGASFDYRPEGPLVDSRGNPILIAAYHTNTPGNPHSNAQATYHTNTAPTHANTPWTNHGNAPGGHTDSAWSNSPHSNLPGGVHTNLVPGDYVF